MATLFKPTRPYLLPQNPTIVQHDGKPHVCIAERGKEAYYPLSRDGLKYLKPAEKWYAKYRDANGVVRVVPLCPRKDADRLMLAELLRNVEAKKAGVTDRLSEHNKRTVSAHLDETWSIRSADMLKLDLALLRMTGTKG